MAIIATRARRSLCIAVACTTLGALIGQDALAQSQLPDVKGARPESRTVVQDVPLGPGEYMDRAKTKMEAMRQQFDATIEKLKSLRTQDPLKEATAYVDSLISAYTTFVSAFGPDSLVVRAVDEAIAIDKGHTVAVESDTVLSAADKKEMREKFQARIEKLENQKKELAELYNEFKRLIPRLRSSSRYMSWEHIYQSMESFSKSVDKIILELRQLKDDLQGIINRRSIS
jgi:hypothetical protein